MIYMRPMFTTKRCLAVLAFVCGGTFVYGQLPAGFPSAPNTGNPELDAVQYEQAKQAWYATQPGTVTNAVPLPAQAQVPASQEALNAQSEAAKTAAAAAASPDRTAERQANELRELWRTYSLNKDLWAATNPELILQVQAQLGISPQVSVSLIPQSEFLTFDAEKQAFLLANPSLFTIVQD